MQNVAIGTVQTQHIEHRFPVSGKYRLSNSQQRRTLRHPQQGRSLGIGDGSVHVFVGIGDAGVEVLFQKNEKRPSLKLLARDTTVCISGEIGILEREWLASSLP